MASVVRGLYKKGFRLKPIIVFSQIGAIILHLIQSLHFFVDHQEITEIVGRAKLQRAPFVFATLDSFLLLLLFTSLARDKISLGDYLIDPKNYVCYWIKICTVFCSWSYVFFAVDNWARNPITPNTFKQLMQRAINDYPVGPAKSLVDRIQLKYSCCGANNYTDWFASNWMGSGPRSMRDHVPFSCCSVVLRVACVHHNLLKYKALTIWTSGCASKFEDVYLRNFEWLICFGVIIGISTFLLVTVSRLLRGTNYFDCGEKLNALVESDSGYRKKHSSTRLSLASSKTSSILAGSTVDLLASEVEENDLQELVSTGFQSSCSSPIFQSTKHAMKRTTEDLWAQYPDLLGPTNYDCCSEMDSEPSLKPSLKQNSYRSPNSETSFNTPTTSILSVLYELKRKSGDDDSSCAVKRPKK